MRHPGLGVRAAAAALFATGLALAMGVPRPYWVELTAVIIVDETVGDSARRARHRLVMTALGCPLGWLLARGLASHHDLLVALLFLFVFLAVYVRPVSVPLTVFFISVYVVFLFAVMGQWTAALVWERVLDTAMGCVAALAAVLPGWSPVGGEPLDVDGRTRAWSLVSATLDGEPHAAALRRALVVEAGARGVADPERPLLEAALDFTAAAEWAGLAAARAAWHDRLRDAFALANTAPAPAHRPFGRAAVVDDYGARLERLFRGASTGRTSP